MANAWYPLYKQNVLAGTSGYDLDNDNATDGPFCALIDTGTYTYSSSHDFYSDLSGVVGTDQRITSPTVTNGTFDGSDLVFTSVSGSTVEALIIYRHNAGANTTWPVVLYIDSSVTGLPVTPNGGNINVNWNASGISTISDGDVKEDVTIIDKVGPAEIVEFRYRGSKERTIGLIAQQVEQWAPDAVRQFNNHRKVNYDLAMQIAMRMAA